MNCTICGKPTRPGATLCVPCRKALKRARYESVLDVSPLQGKRGSAVSSMPLDAIDGLPAASSPRAILGARTTRLWTAVGILVVGSAVVLALLQGSGSGAHPVATAVVAQSTQEPERASNDAMPSAAQRSAAPPGALSAANTASSSAGQPSPAVHPSANGAVTPAADVGKGSTARPEGSPRVSAKTTVVINAIAEENTPIEAFGPVAPPPRKVEAPPVMKAPPPVDRWQLLADAIARCDGDFFARLSCEQHARSQYCENYWGLVPQCPSVAPTEHGQ